MSKVSNKKTNIWQRLLCAALPILCMTLLAACGEEQVQENPLVLFDENGYKFKLVYSYQRQDWEDAAIVRLYDGLEDLCGSAPELIVDAELADTEGSREIIIGSTNRPESAFPELGAADSYWSVVIGDEKVVINGNNEYAIGLAVDHFLSQWAQEDFTGTLVMSEEQTKEVTMKDYYREGWLLKNIPAYQGSNVLATNLYSCGTYLTEYGKKDATNLVMQSVRQTTAEEADAYAKIMLANGYTEESHTSIENNQFYRFVKDNQRVYVNFYGNEGRATIELDESGKLSALLGSYTYEPKAGEQTEYYMFGLKMDPYGYSLKQEKNTSGYIDNGACLVVKLADNSVILIDGGAAQQMGKEDADRLYRFLCGITDTQEGNVIKVAAWYITHFDSDHTCGFSAAITANPERYDLQRLVCNLPDLAVTSKTDYNAIVSPNGAVRKNYPDVQEIRLRTGDVLQLADVTITTFFSHADFADEAGKYNTTNFNSTSTVAMFTSAAGMKMLVTGDSIAKAESIYCHNFSAESFKCDIMQQPHHNRTDISTLYEYANAQVMLFTQAVGTLTENATDRTRSELAKQWCSEWYCGGTETVGFQWTDGKAELIYREQDIYN